MIATLIIFFILYLFIVVRRLLRVCNKRPVWVIVFIVITAICLQAQAHGAESVAMGQGKAQKTLTVTPHNPALPQKTFRVVLVCDTQELRGEGLQGFRKLEKDEAALFIFDKPEAVTFWMGSVQYPIDIIFVGPDKKVTRVYANRKPGSNELFPSMTPAKWTIETAAGSGIKAGDRVRFD